MRFRQGVEAEVLLSLALVMVTGTALLAGIFLEISQARVESLHGLLGRGFVSETRAQGAGLRAIEGGSFWRIDDDGRVTGINASAERLDESTRMLAREARSLGEPLVASGAPWRAVRFASPDPLSESIYVGRLDAPVSGVVLATVIGVDVLVFGLFGITLLRRRVVGPLRRLAGAVREMGGGEVSAPVPVEGIAEIEELGTAFNEMQEALASRTGALEKAVVELRQVNGSLVQAREGLDRAERLAMVGSLAAGVAHEVGNPMGALLAFLDVAARDPGLSEQSRRCLTRASEQGERVRIILRQLLDFSRPPQVERVPIDLGEVAEQVIQLVSAQQEYADIEFEVHIDERAGCAVGDRSVASQILLNLALNAASAMKDQAEKRLRIVIEPAVRRCRAEDGDSGAQSELRSDSVACWVADSGPGVCLDDPERIFDPFFTTKAPGEGTGLGLANARRLAEEMAGRLDLDGDGSELGGARFRFLLPIATPGEMGSRGVRKPAMAQSRIS